MDKVGEKGNRMNGIRAYISEFIREKARSKALFTLGEIVSEVNSEMEAKGSPRRIKRVPSYVYSLLKRDIIKRDKSSEEPYYYYSGPEELTSNPVGFYKHAFGVSKLRPHILKILRPSEGETSSRNPQPARFLLVLDRVIESAREIQKSSETLVDELLSMSTRLSEADDILRNVADNLKAAEEVASEISRLGKSKITKTENRLEVKKVAAILKEFWGMSVRKSRDGHLIVSNGKAVVKFRCHGDHASIPVKLRMNKLNQLGVDNQDFLIYCQ